MHRKTNVIENIKPECTVESRVTQALLGSFGHVTRKEHGVENNVMFV